MTDRARRITNEIIDSLGSGKHVEDNPIEPDHYRGDGVECIDALRACLSPDGFQGFCAGNVIKYVWRYREKNGTEDLNKARWYLDKLIEVREDESSGSDK